MGTTDIPEGHPHGPNVNSQRTHHMINRAALLLRYKTPAVQWINEAFPGEDNPGITAASVNRERVVYLISDKDGESDESVRVWVRKNFKVLLEAELERWYTDADLWPQRRDFNLFLDWFDVEYHTVVIDTVGGDIHDTGM
jgi:hypothetical protein